MRFPRLVLSIAAIFARCSAWECDARCPVDLYLQCLVEEAKRNRRALEPMSIAHDPFELEEPTTTTVDMSFHARSDKTLRGSHRRLQTVYFQLKMYHEPGYCWQAEWDDRIWCAQCQGDCEDWDYLEIQSCNTEENKQYFQYEAMPDGIGGRIKPLSNDNLCWERTRVNAHQLRPCDDINRIVNVTQIFRGFDMYNKFELHPYNRGNFTTNAAGPMCLDNEHHPKSEEVIRAESCDRARADKTSYWITYNKYTEGDVNSVPSSPVPTPEPSSWPVASAPLPTPRQSPSTNLPPKEPLSTQSPTTWPTWPTTTWTQSSPTEDPPVVDWGWWGCSVNAKCPNCHGDCDNDDECQGDLICYKRAPNSTVPTCSGGENIRHGTLMLSSACDNSSRCVRANEDRASIAEQQKRTFVSHQTGGILFESTKENHHGEWGLCWIGICKFCILAELSHA